MGGPPAGDLESTAIGAAALLKRLAVKLEEHLKAKEARLVSDAGTKHFKDVH